ncbi:unnamed protein product [Clonostachys rosea]|uniref:F-box domain-containing protein n=1 Tax=Bionectria ochroleuca TaxID=29856 RepID=A0ABY6U412_BIOOC|nr:unnamed protein product [Clonostachys rosea]
MAETAYLIGLPPEILHHILIWLDPADLAPVSKVCQFLYKVVKGNQKLCQDIYLLQMDAPPDTASIQDWESELHDMVKLDGIFHKLNDAEKEADRLPFVCETVSRLLKHASLNHGSRDEGEESERHVSRNVEYLSGLFENEVAARVFTQQSPLFDRINSRFQGSVPFPQPLEKHQQSAKLHCLFGRPAQRGGRTRSTTTYPWACSKVYDIRDYSQANWWGPFRRDGTGRVDWEKLEAINILMWKNISTQCPRTDLFDEIWDTPFFGSFAHSYVPTNLPKLSDLDAQDPYGVAGTYYRVVCFLDHSDFIRFNFSNMGIVTHNMPRPPLDRGEAVRLILMDLEVTRVEPPGPDDGQELPVVHFKGVSRSFDTDFMEDVHSTLTGSVRLTKEGEVRWSSVSAFDGQERWRSEGVQIGGVQSARGVVGTWFDSDYDIHGPVGPTAFWKAADCENPREALLKGASDMILQPEWIEGVVITFENEDGESEDDDDNDEDWDADLDPVEDELPGLLEDAEMDLDDVTTRAMGNT